MTLGRLESWRAFWVLLVAETLLLSSVNLLDFPLSVPHMVRLTGHTYLDMCAFCTAPRIYDTLTAFGERGRLQQLQLMTTLDVAIPVLSLLFAVVALKTLAKRSPNALLLFPCFAFVLDLVENAGIIGITTEYPTRINALATFVGVASGLKFCAYGLTLVLIAGFSARRVLCADSEPSNGRTEAPRCPRQPPISHFEA